MAIFGKKRTESSNAPSVGLAAPIVVEPGDIERVRTLLAQFNQAVGTNDELREFGVAFNRAGGYLSDTNSLAAIRTNPEATKRPWYWLAAVARDAFIEGDGMLVAQIALMTQFWNSQIAPKLGTADWFDGIVDSSSERARAEIFSVALEALPLLPSEAVVMENQTGVLHVHEVLGLSAGEVLAVESLVDPTTAASARQILGR